MVDQVVIDEIRERVDIVELVGRHVQLRRQGKYYMGLCPWHDDSRPSLQVNPERQSYKCWVCDIGGDAFGFLMKMDGLSFPEAIHVLADRVGVKINISNGEKREYSEKEEIYKALEKATLLYERQLEKNPDASSYVRSRGITDETSKNWSIGFAPDKWDFILNNSGFSANILEQAGLLGTTQEPGKYYDRFRGRIVFPIKDLTGRVVGFAGRILPQLERGQSVKYINSPETPVYSKSKILYGLDVAGKSIRKTGEAIVVEGYTDTILAHQEGLANFISTGGIAFTTNHLEIMNRRFPDARIILCYDGDDGGRKGAFRATKELIGRGNTRVCFLPEGLDPADMLEQGDKKTLEEKLAMTVPVFDFYVDFQTQGRDLRNPDEAANFLQAVSGDLKKVPPHLQGIYFEALSRRTGFSKDSIEACVHNKSNGFSDVDSNGMVNGRQIRGRGFWESVLINGFVQSDQYRKYFSTRLNAQLFTNPVRRALFQYLVGPHEEVPLFTGPLFSGEVEQVIGDILHREPGLDRDYLKKLLTRSNSRKPLRLEDMEFAIKNLLGFEALGIIERSAVRGYSLKRIDDSVNRLKKELE